MPFYICARAMEVLKIALLFTSKTRLVTFPTRVPTWNEKLGELGMRKNVTQNEWRKIFRHCRPRLEDSTRRRGDLKLKRTRKKTEVIVRNRPYTWDKAWKNMKNAGAIAQLLNPEGQLLEKTLLCGCF